MDIEAYLLNDMKVDVFSAKSLVRLLKKHPDLKDEFIGTIKTGIYPENGVKSGEWTAKALAEKLPHLTVCVIYEFMVGLRDNPSEYEGYIAEGAPIL